MAATVPFYDPDRCIVEWFDMGAIHGTHDEGILALYTRGHVDPKAFWRQAVKEFAAYGVTEDDIPFAAHVQHETWRKVPGREGMIIVRGVPGSRGSFPVTVISLREWER